MAAITLVRLLAAVHPLVSVQVVALNEPHITCIAGKWLFSCQQSMEEHGFTDLQCSATDFRAVGRKAVGLFTKT